MGRRQRALNKLKAKTSAKTAKIAKKAVESILKGTHYQAPSIEIAVAVIYTLREALDFNPLTGQELVTVAQKLFKDHHGEISVSVMDRTREFLNQGWSILYPTELKTQTGEGMVEIRIVEVGDESRHTQDRIRDSLLLLSANKL